MALSSSLVTFGIFVGIYGLLALGLNLKFGYNGLLDIGHVAFYLIGAYTTALLVAPSPESQQFIEYILGWNWPWFAAIPAGVIVAGIFGMLVALPAIRLREDYLAITLLGVSVIAQRVIQVEKWLANGPGTLRGYGVPLRSYFPLPGTSPQAAAILGVVVGIFWAAMAYFTIQLLARRETQSDGTSIATLLPITAVLGVGNLELFNGLRSKTSSVWLSIAVGVIAGSIAGIATSAGNGTSTVFVFFGVPSLFTWILGATALALYYANLTARDVVIAAGLAVAFVVAFLPLILLGGKQTGDVSSSIGLLGTIVLLALYLYGLYYAGSNWTRIGTNSKFVHLLGVAAVFLFAFRYFLFALVMPFKRGGIGAASTQLLQNILWLMKFQTTTPNLARFLSETVVIFDYNRFLLALIFGILAIVYLMLERTVASPFGRVLKSIREDEDVAIALGKNTFAYKIQTMILGSAIAGLAGALWAIYATSLVFTMFAPRVTFFAFLMVIIGGTANNRGVILGSVIYWAFEQGTSDIAAFFPTAARSSVQALRLAFIGALLIVILYYRPEGIWGERRMVTATGGEDE